jgi:hypothetical protein
MNSKKIFKISFVVVSISLVWSLITLNKYKKAVENNVIEVYLGGDIEKGHTIDSLQNLVDSLQNENYPCQIELNRHKVAYEIFLERNPKAASQYGDIISQETE